MSTQPQKSTRGRAEPVAAPAERPEADSVERRSSIALAAYFIAEKRGFAARAEWKTPTSHALCTSSPPTRVSLAMTSTEAGDSSIYA